MTSSEPDTERLFLGTTPGLEEALSEEATAVLGPLGAQLSAPVAGGVELEGPAGLYQEANIRMRIASRVLLRLGSFQAGDESSLGRGLKAVDLSAYWDGRSFLGISVASHRSRLSKGAQIRRMAERAWRLPSSREPSVLGSGTELLIRLNEDRCEVSVDSSGELLHRRGYRQEVSRAPLRETLAAGLLRLAGYDGMSPLWDPMCGSGTIGIEAALLALGRAPGRDRDFAFRRWPSFDPERWNVRWNRLREAERMALPQPIRLSDLNAGALGTARRNARRAMVLEQLQLDRLDATRLSAPTELGPGLVIANLPYGVRVGDGKATLATELVTGLRRGGFHGWRIALFIPRTWKTAPLALESPAVSAIDNGGIPCQLVQSVL
jgi:putative N6-adenine-specific DNA methylase